MSNKLEITSGVGNGSLKWTRSDDPEIPSAFEASYVIDVHLEAGGLLSQNAILLSFPLSPDGGLAAPYDQAELEAARMIPGILREVADQAEKQIEKSYEERELQKTRKPSSSG